MDLDVDALVAFERGDGGGWGRLGSLGLGRRSCSSRLLCFRSLDRLQLFLYDGWFGSLCLSWWRSILLGNHWRWLNFLLLISGSCGRVGSLICLDLSCLVNLGLRSLISFHGLIRGLVHLRSLICLSGLIGLCRLVRGGRLVSLGRLVDLDCLISLDRLVGFDRLIGFDRLVHLSGCVDLSRGVHFGRGIDLS